MPNSSNNQNPKQPEKKQIIIKKSPPGGGKSPEKSSIASYVLSVLIIFVALSALYSYLANSKGATMEISISQLVTDIKSGTVKDVTVQGDAVTIDYKDGTKKTSKKETSEALSQTLVNLGVPSAQLSQVNIQNKDENGFSYWFLNLAPIIFPIFLFLIIIWFITRQVRGAGMQALTFGQSKARMIDPNDKSQRVTFKDVAGAREAKEELTEIVDFLRNPKKFLDIGARIPKGIILMGPPGTGKTLLARAVAGEAGVAFFSISGSEFVEMFVGVGASRVRDLFLMAKKNSPSIIFVDEIDAVGRVRGVGAGGGNDEREQTLNQILVEMDGFEPAEKVIVMAATNRPDVLDPALLRPGRFDRRVTLDLPDRGEREEILQVHSKEKPFAEDVALKVIAERTPGFSGADLYSLMNEGAILAARENRTTVAQYDLIRSIEKVMLGPERKSHILSKKEKEIAAYHEAGHAVLASILPYADPVHKVSIISRGRAAGYVLKLPLDDRKLQSKKEFLDDIAVSLGGYVTEQMLFDDLTTGPSSDLQVSTALARDMVTKYGMSETLGPIALESFNGKVIFGRGVEEKDFSEKVAADIDAEVSRIMKEAHQKAINTISENRKLLDAIAKRLIDKETIERAEFETILVANGITPKKKLDIEHQT